MSKTVSDNHSSVRQNPYERASSGWPKIAQQVDEIHGASRAGGEFGVWPKVEVYQTNSPKRKKNEIPSSPGPLSDEHSSAALLHVELQEQDVPGDSNSEDFLNPMLEIESAVPNPPNVAHLACAGLAPDRASAVTSDGEHSDTSSEAGNIHATELTGGADSECGDVFVDELHRIEAIAKPFQNAPISQEIARLALDKLEKILRPPRATGPGYKECEIDDAYSLRRVNAMAACLHLYCNTTLGWTVTYASGIAAIGAGFGSWYGKKIRRFIRSFINTDDLPGNKYGTRNASTLEDEDLATEIKEHLQTKGKYIKANDIVEYLENPSA
ncbi:hypothetical protein BDV93DRAFT_595830 [Ceratobasidium sp. AG-I]|nr:hypothetical protein BDV93DRAFT_595830 [Ceratobasidium sp. AG-I]